MRARFQSLILPALLMSLLAAPVQAQTGQATPPATQQSAQATPPATQQTAGQTAAQTGSAPGSTLSALPSVSLGDPEAGYTLPIQLLLLLTVLSLAPAIVILTTSFTRLVIVLGLMRQALGTAQSPPTQVLIGLAMFLSLFIMYPVFTQINEEALQPYMDGSITQTVALERASKPMKKFMLAQTREKDLLLFMDMANTPAFASGNDAPFYVLVPAYVISELRIAFQIGFMIFLPFLMVDLIVASVLMSMGMMMLPPMMISLPLKLLLFVLADGWYLIVESIVRAYIGA
jgi:flagellar biosynthesis protein FliP